MNLALAKWTLDALAEFSGYTVQFEHQGVTFGVAAFYAMGEWEFSNGYVDLDTGDASDFTDATGTFTPGSPALLSVQFDKSHFPHADASDNQLRSFRAGTADFKYYVPFGFADVEPPAPAPVFGCDDATGSLPYTFQTGGHSGHDAGASPANQTADEGDVAPVEPLAEDGAGAAPEPAGANDTPAPGALPALAAAALASAAWRRRRA